MISNCVINLAPDKPAVFREIHRVLKPGGRLAVSDIALKKDLPSEVRGNLSAYIGCLAGAIRIELYQAQLLEAGFAGVEVVDTGVDLGAYAQAENAACCLPSESSNPQMLPTTQASGCCGESGGQSSSCAEPRFHTQLAELLRRYDVNEFAASVRVFAVKAL